MGDVVVAIKIGAYIHGVFILPIIPIVQCSHLRKMPNNAVEILEL